MTEQTQAVARAASDDGRFSKQPRFDDDSRQGLLGAFMSFAKRASDELNVPPYLANSIARDHWLQNHWALEPHWAGVVNQTVLVDSSRSWEMIGGRNQVRRFTAMLHNADNGKGWRNFFRRQSLGYRTTDMGAVTELGRDGEGGPLRAIFHTDASRCRWTGKSDTPLEYNPAGGGSQDWTNEDFFNVTSLPNPREEFYGLGYCQTSRAWDLLRLFYAVMMHDQELTGARFPKGILFLHNVTEPQWDTMLRGRESQLEGKNIQYFGGLMIIASMGDVLPDGKLLAFSQLPANFDRATFINQTMYGYALVTGYDPSEFWPVSGGSLGSGKETEQQHRKAISKGAMEFPQAWQERFQQQLPPSLLFQFEQRDAEGELLDAQVAQRWAEVGATLYQSGGLALPPLLDQQAILRLLAEQSSLLDAEAVETMTEAVATDERPQEVTERARQIPQVQRAIEQYPGEPIVRYCWPTGVEQVLWECGDDALRPRAWRGATVARQDEPEPEILYMSPDGDIVITSDDVDRAVLDWDKTMPEQAVGLLEAGEAA